MHRNNLGVVLLLIAIAASGVRMLRTERSAARHIENLRVKKFRYGQGVLLVLAFAVAFACAFYAFKLRLTVLWIAALAGVLSGIQVLLSFAVTRANQLLRLERMMAALFGALAVLVYLFVIR